MKRIFLSVLILPALASAEEIDVTIHIIGIEQQKGAVYAGLFDAETWSGDRRLATAKADIAGNEATLHLAAPHPGTYAIKMFHDLNGNGLLDPSDGPAIRSTNTSSNGAYAFSGLAAGNYLVTEAIASGYSGSGALLHAFSIHSGSIITAKDFAEATELTKKCPLLGEYLLEVRLLKPMGQ